MSPPCHVIVTALVAGGNATFVAKEDLHARPVDDPGVPSDCHARINRPRCIAARQRQSEAAAISARLDRQVSNTSGGAIDQILAIGKDLSGHDLSQVTQLPAPF